MQFIKEISYCVLYIFSIFIMFLFEKANVKFIEVKITNKGFWKEVARRSVRDIQNENYYSHY